MVLRTARPMDPRAEPLAARNPESMRPSSIIDKATCKTVLLSLRSRAMRPLEIIFSAGA